MARITGCFENENIVARATRKCDNGHKMKNRKFQNTISREWLNVFWRSPGGMKTERTTTKKKIERFSRYMRATCHVRSKEIYGDCYSCFHDKRIGGRLFHFRTFAVYTTRAKRWNSLVKKFQSYYNVKSS